MESEVPERKDTSDHQHIPQRRRYRHMLNSKLLAIIAVLFLLSALPILAEDYPTCTSGVEATLSGLGVRVGSLSPSFSSRHYDYELEVDSDVVQLDFYPVTTDFQLPTSAIWLNGNRRACGNVGEHCVVPSNIEVYIGSGTPTITISVVPQGDSFTCPSPAPRKDYTITVTRAQPPSSNTEEDEEAEDVPSEDPYEFVVNTPIAPIVFTAYGFRNGIPPYTYTTEDLPPGLTFNSATRTLSGTPTTVGTYFSSYFVNDNVSSG